LRRSRQVLEQSYSLQAVGEIFGISGQRVRQIEARALGKLRRLARAKPGRSGDRRAAFESVLTYSD
jgi:DNA-directed RNA polymerase sigma subunit (sigma70/sigma32)